MEKATQKNNYHYNKQLKTFARELRNNGTKSEACFWKYLVSSRQFHGYQFLRQRPILNYIADFVCFELMLVIELDGLTHDFEEVVVKDIQKEKILISVGFTVFRFSDWEVLNRMTDVNEILTEWLENRNI
jgi:very-short-patch-repair endonuclease